MHNDGMTCGKMMSSTIISTHKIIKSGVLSKAIPLPINMQVQIGRTNFVYISNCKITDNLFTINGQPNLVLTLMTIHGSNLKRECMHLCYKNYSTNCTVHAYYTHVLYKTTNGTTQNYTKIIQTKLHAHATHTK